MIRVFYLIIVFHSFGAYSQNKKFYIFLEDYNNYFKDSISKFERYYGFEHLKENLPDGTYYFYDTKKTDSINSNIALIAHYRNFSKDSIFESFEYINHRNKKKVSYYAFCVYKNGLKNGVDYACNYVYKNSMSCEMIKFSNYLNGQKHGINIEFTNGEIYKIIHFENGNIQSIEFQNSYYSNKNKTKSFILEQ